MYSVEEAESVAAWKIPAALPQDPARAQAGRGDSLDYACVDWFLFRDLPASATSSESKSHGNAI
jgi:hypothetical protein